MNGWPAVSSEEAPWHLSDDDTVFIPKAKRRKITATYRAAIPALLSERTLTLPSELIEQLSETRSLLTRFDERQAALPFNMPSLLLRSESAASSQIENLTSSARNIALAELSPSAPKNAQIIAGNIAAMRCALSLSGPSHPKACVTSIAPFSGKAAPTSQGSFARSKCGWVVLPIAPMGRSSCRP